MKTFKELDIKNWEDIASYVLEHCQHNGRIYNRTEGLSLIPLLDNVFLKIKPLIDNLFLPYLLTCTKAHVYVMHNEHEGALHCDNSKHNARINFPILNCNNTYTEFYSVDKSIYFTNSKYTIKLPANDATIKLINRVEIKQPTVLNVNAYHKVILNSDNRPRITLSLSFNQDPIFLL
jgi:hypothetical protein